MNERSFTPTVSEYVECIWSPATVYAASTLARMRSILVRQVLPWLGGQQLSMITPSEVARMLSEIETKGSRSSAATALSTLRSVFQHAIRLGLLDQDPATGIRIRPLTRRRRVYLIPPNVLVQTLDHLDTRARALLALVCYLGLRPSEALALRWHDIDPNGGLLAVRWPSSSGGRGASRYVPLIGPVRDALDEHHRLVGGQGHEFVFGRGATSPRPDRASAWLRKFAPIMAAAGLPQTPPGRAMTGRRGRPSLLSAGSWKLDRVGHLV